jgi:hypothetical protein
MSMVNGKMEDGSAELRRIRVWVDETVQPPEPRAEPDEAHISRARRDRVEWYLDFPEPASLEIRFKQTNPLTELSCPRPARQCNGGHARDGTVGRRFPYMIIVTSGKERYESDPDIIVDP